MVVRRERDGWMEVDDRIVGRWEDRGGDGVGGSLPQARGLARTG